MHEGQVITGIVLAVSRPITKFRKADKKPFQIRHVFIAGLERWTFYCPTIVPEIGDHIKFTIRDAYYKNAQDLKIISNATDAEYEEIIGGIRP